MSIIFKIFLKEEGDFPIWQMVKIGKMKYCTDLMVFLHEGHIDLNEFLLMV